jgi:hypothetical protein
MHWRLFRAGGRATLAGGPLLAVGVLNVTLNLVVIPRWSYLEARAVALFSWTDLVPFLGDLQRAIRLFLSPQERRKRDHRNSQGRKSLKTSMK